MILIFTDNEQLNEDLNNKIENSRIVYYPDYVLQEKEANISEFMLKVREKNIRVILLLENEKVKELKDALNLGIYDIIFDPFSLEDIVSKVNNPTPFSSIAKYFK